MFGRKAFRSRNGLSAGNQWSFGDIEFRKAEKSHQRRECPEEKRFGLPEQHPARESFRLRPAGILNGSFKTSVLEKPGRKDFRFARNDLTGGESLDASGRRTHTLRQQGFGLVKRKVRVKSSFGCGKRGS